MNDDVVGDSVDEVDESLHFRFDPAIYVDFDNPSEDLFKIKEDLEKKIVEFGVLSLAATQLGYESRVFAINTKENDVMCLFNPEIIMMSQDTVPMKEGDVMFPNLFVTLRRPRFVEIEFYTVDGEKQSIGLDGLAARCVLHELDSLNGILFLSRASKLKLRRAVKSKMKREKFGAA